MRKERGISQEAWSEEMGSAKILRELGRCVLSGVLVCSFITCMLNAILSRTFRLLNHDRNSQYVRTEQTISVGMDLQQSCKTSKCLLNSGLAKS